VENSVYTLNKGINKPLEFKGLKAQYIWYLGVGLVALLFLFAMLYIVVELDAFSCAGIILVMGVGLVLKIYQLSHQYGQHGLMKRLARRQVPLVVKSYSRLIFKLNS